MRLMVCIVFLASLGATVVLAHDTWMLASSVTKDGLVTFAVTSGMDFPRNEAGPKANRVASAGWRLGGREGRLPAGVEGDSVLTVEVAIEGEGTAVAKVTFHPREIDLEEEDVAHYFEEIGVPDKLRRAWESGGSDRKFHEVYTKHAKAFVRVGDAGDDPTCATPVGLALELVPARDPTGLSAGDALGIQVVKGGKPFPDFAVSAVCGTDGKTLSRRSDASGRVSLPIHREGPWLVRGTDLRLKDDGTWESDFTTMTFTVGK